jgi:hypothetical protein
LLFDLGEHGGDVLLPGDVERHEDRRTDFAHKRLDISPGFFAGAGNGKLCAELMEGLRAPPGNGMLVGDPADQCLLALQNRGVAIICHDDAPTENPSMFISGTWSGTTSSASVAATTSCTETPGAVSNRVSRLVCLARCEVPGPCFGEMCERLRVGVAVDRA